MERLSRTLLNLRMHNAHACYPQEKWPTLCMDGHQRERALDHRNALIIEKTLFRPSLPAEYATAVS